MSRRSSMCQSAPLVSLASISLTSYLANLNPTLLDTHLRAPPDTLGVSVDTPLTPTLAFDFAVSEVIWLGVPGPS